MNATIASTLNGQKLVSATIMEPSTGNWTADVSVETEDSIEGEVFALVSSEPFAGAVVRGAIDGGTWSGRIEGGRGGMQKQIRARSYTRATVGMVLADIAGDSKEKISPTISPGILSRPLTSWTRIVGTTQRAVADLADKLEMKWRITRTGEIWIGEDLFQPVFGLTYKQLSQGANDSAIIAPQKPGVSPGDLFDSRQVNDVITRLSPDALEQTIIFKGEESTGITKILQRIVYRMIGRRVDFSGSYPAKVLIQRGDDTLDVLIDDPRLRGDGLKNVPIRLGIPGARCEVNPGARVRIHYDEQDQSKPFAALWDTNPADVTVVEIGGGATSEAARSDLVDDEIGRIWDVLTTWTVSGGDGGAALKAAAGAAQTSVVSTACTTLKVL